MSSFVVCWFQNHFLLTRSRESWLWTNKCYLTCFFLFFFFFCCSSFVGEISFVLQQFCLEQEGQQINQPTNQQNVFGLNVFKFLRPSCTITKNQAETEHNRTPFTYRCILCIKALHQYIQYHQCAFVNFSFRNRISESFSTSFVCCWVFCVFLFVLFLSFISASIQADALILVPNCEWNSAKKANAHTTKLIHNDVLHCNTNKC